MNDTNYINPAQIKKQFSITSNTLRTWTNQGKIRCIRPNGTRRLYNANDVKTFFGVVEPINTTTVCYARVSSQHQKQDLERQVKFLQSQYPNARIFKDVGSGLNWKRPGFTAVLEAVHKGDVGTVVVTYKDRLCRFGNELVEWIFKKANVKLVVLSKSDEEDDPSREVSEDLLAITTVFVARNNGLRAGRYRRERNKIPDEENQTTREEKESTGKDVVGGDGTSED